MADDPRRGAVPGPWHEYRKGWTSRTGEVIEEALVTLYVNGREVATVMCTPRDQAWLALGFLKNEDLLDGRDEVEVLFVSRDGCCVDVWLNRAFRNPERAIVTSGCGGGVTFTDPGLDQAPLPEGRGVEPEVLLRLFNSLHQADSLHARARGVHAAALSDGDRVLAMVEDVGRHNTVDKLRGACLEMGIETRGQILLTTGRVSSEMLRKGARMGCPVIASRNSPTSLSVAMARAWNITLVGYVRQGSMRVYAHPERLGYPGAAEAGEPTIVRVGTA